MLLSCLLNACGVEQTPPPSSSSFPLALAAGVQQIGYISDPLLKEDSGVVASRSDTNVFWTHTDGAKVPILFAINRTGKTLAQFPLKNITLHDWEDIAADDEGNIYIGDIGNNDAARDEIYVARVPEPLLNGERRSLSPDRNWTLRFPGKPFDCESLFIRKDYGYVASKLFYKRRGALYRFSLKAGPAPQVLEKVCLLPINSPVTGADISPDGKKIAFVAHSGVYVFAAGEDLQNLSSSLLFHIPFKHQHVEGCAFVPEGLLVTSENREVFLFTNKGF